MKPKIRIQLLDKKGVVVSDRLVDQYTELLQGPKDKHDGPIRIEVSIFDEPTIENFKTYLDKLKGTIPLEKPLPKKTPQEKVNPYKEIFVAIKQKEHIEDIIEYLDNLNFRFLSGQLIEELAHKIPGNPTNDIDISYQWMVRVLRYAKDPANDKFDFSMLVGIKFLGKKSNKVIVFYNGKLKATLTRKWLKGDVINLKKKKIPMVFPDYMTIEERKKWRYVRRKVELNKPIGQKEQKFYDRYKLDIKNLNEGKGFNL